MSIETVPPMPPVNPRPGVVKTLGILNIVFAVLGGICIVWSGFMMFGMMTASMGAQPAEVKVEVKAGAPAAPGTPMVAMVNPFMGMNDPKFLRFSFIENGVSLIINGLMFATGIGLLNLRRWAALGWTYLAWFRIVFLILIWGYFVIAIVPSFSENMAKTVVDMMRQQNPGRAVQLPTVGYMTQVYSIMCLIVAVGSIVISSIYPAISIWLLSRPRVKAALVDKPAPEPEFL
jgi:hypothetical protein